LTQRRVVDLREQSERRANPVEGAEAWTVDELAHQHSALEQEDELYLVGGPDECRQAADILADVGFKNARHYQQGLHLWKGEYFPDNIERLKDDPLLTDETEGDAELPLTGQPLGKRRTDAK